MKATNKNLLRAIVEREDKRLFRVLKTERLLEHLIKYKNVLYDDKLDTMARYSDAPRSFFSHDNIPKEEKEYILENILENPNPYLLSDFYKTLPPELKRLFIFVRDMNDDGFLKHTVIPSLLVINGGLEKLIKLDNKYGVSLYQKKSISLGYESTSGKGGYVRRLMPTSKNMLSERTKYLVDPELNPLIVNYLSNIRIGRNEIIKFIEAQYKFEALILQRGLKDSNQENLEFCSGRTLSSSVPKSLVTTLLAMEHRDHRSRRTPRAMYWNNRTAYARKSLQDKKPEELYDLAQKALKQSDKYFGKIKTSLLN